MKVIFIGIVAIAELIVFLALAKAAFTIFTPLSAILFCAIIGAIAVSAILGILRLFRMFRRRDFMKEYSAAMTT